MDPVEASLLAGLYVVYGLSFVVMGTLALIHAADHSDSPTLRDQTWIGAFGILHGLHEILLAAMTLTPGTSTTEDWWRAGTLLLSYLPLVEYARRAAVPVGAGRSPKSERVALLLYAVLASVVAAAALSSDPPAALAATARVGMALPASLLAGAAFLGRLRSPGESPWTTRFRVLGGGAFLGYGVLSVFLLTPPPGLPGWIPTAAAFHAWAGVPVIVFRAAAALVILLALAAMTRQAILRHVEAARLLALDMTSELRVVRHALESAPHGVAIAGLDGRLDYVNPAFARMWGLPDTESAADRHLTEFWISPDEAVGVMEEILARGKWAGRMTAKSAHGTATEVEVAAFAVRPPSGEVLALMAWFLDRTEHLRAEEELGALSKRLQQTQNIARVGSWELDLAGERLTWSPETCRIFGVGEPDAPDDQGGFFAFVHPEDSEEVVRSFQRAVETRTRFACDHRIVTPEGEVRWVAERADILFDVHGRPVSAVGAVQDITPLQEANLKLQSALREKETLLREIHHRVKNNLQVVSSLLFLQAKKTTSPEALAALEEGRDRLRAMSLVHDALHQAEDLSRIAFDEYLLRLASYFRDAYADDERRVGISVEACPCTLSVESALPLGIVVSELVGNALKHAFPEGRTGSIRIATAWEEGHLSVSVSDDGVGLPDGFILERRGSFGWELIPALVAQLRGAFEVSNGTGVTITVRIPSQELGA